MAHTVAKTSAQTKENIKNKSPYGMPDSPSSQGWNPTEIKEAFWRFVLDNANSIMAELDRICDEASAMTVGTANIDAGAVTSAKIAAAAIITSLLADNAVTTAKVADANITTAKIADANVTTAKIADANVTTGKLADGAVTNAKVNDVAMSKVTNLSSTINALLPSLFSTTVPTGDNTAGYLKFVHLTEEPATKYNGWIYLIDEEE